VTAKPAAKRCKFSQALEAARFETRSRRIHSANFWIAKWSGGLSDVEVLANLSDGAVDDATT